MIWPEFLPIALRQASKLHVLCLSLVAQIGHVTSNNMLIVVAPHVQRTQETALDVPVLLPKSCLCLPSNGTPIAPTTMLAAAAEMLYSQGVSESD